MTEQYEIVPVEDEFKIVPDEEEDANRELEQIIREFRIADVLNEVARYRIWRFHKNGRWKEIKNQNGDQKFEHWEQLVIEVSELLHCSRQQIYDRVRLYEQLYWLGYSAKESIKMLSDRPSLYDRVLTMVVDWDQRKEQPRSISIPEVSKVSEDQAKKHIRELLEDVATFGTQKDAIRYVSETILLQPQVDFWYNGDVFYVNYFHQVADTNGALHVTDYGNAVFYPDSDLPVWVKERLTTQLKAIGKFNADKKP